MPITFLQLLSLYQTKEDEQYEKEAGYRLYYYEYPLPGLTDCRYRAEKLLRCFKCQL
jgi:hypothetical protein